jgi:DNA end-binding protein Ku
MPNPPAISQGTKYSPGRQESKLIRNDSPRFAFESMANHFDSGLSRNDSRPQVIESEYTMAARANWKGYLKLSLVSCAVALYPATSLSTRVRFHTVNRGTGNRVKRQFIDPASGEPVEAEDQVKGYEVGRGSYVYVEDEELDAIRIESTHTIDIESFVPRDQVDELYLDTPYYIAPEDKVAQEAFAVIRDAMREKGKAGVARVVIARRERMILLRPLGKGLLGTVLRYPYEVRAEDAYFDDIPDLQLSEEMRDLAAHIIERKSAAFEPSQFEDRYENAVVELVRAKQTGEPVRIEEAPRPSNVVNLMEALRRSIAAEEPAGGPPKAPSKTSEERPARKAKREPSSRKAGPSAKKAG